MARRLIGLDVGTNAVTIAEVTPGTPPRLDMFAQVALPRDAMREGEVADEAAVTDAVARLRTEVGLKKVPVRVGIASPRVVVRQVEMPVMTRDELDERVAVPGRRPHPDPDRGRGARLRDPRRRAARRADGAAASRRCRCCSRPRTKRRSCGSSSAVEAGGLAGRRGRPHPARADPCARPSGRRRMVAGGGRRRRGRRSASAPKASCRSVAASRRSPCTKTASRSSCACSAAAAASSPTRSRTDLDVPAETAEALKRALAQPGARRDGRPGAHRGRPSAVGAARRGPQLDRLLPQPARLGAAAPRRRHRWFGAAARACPSGSSALVGVPVEPAYMHDLIAHRRHRVRARRAAAPRAVPAGAGRPRARRRRRRHGHRPAAARTAASARRSCGCERSTEGRRRGRARRRAARRAHVHGAQRGVEREGEAGRGRGRRRRSCESQLGTTSSRRRADGGHVGRSAARPRSTTCSARTSAGRSIVGDIGAEAPAGRVAHVVPGYAHAPDVGDTAAAAPAATTAARDAARPASAGATGSDRSGTGATGGATPHRPLRSATTSVRGVHSRRTGTVTIGGHRAERPGAVGVPRRAARPDTETSTVAVG